MKERERERACWGKSMLMRIMKMVVVEVVAVEVRTLMMNIRTNIQVGYDMKCSKCR